MCWGHVTGVAESNVRAFSGNWTGTGSVSGSGDSEVIEFTAAGQYMESETVLTGAVMIQLLQNAYGSGDSGVMKYRTGATQVECEGASWVAYSAPFLSDGYVQLRVEAA